MCDNSCHRERFIIHPRPEKKSVRKRRRGSETKLPTPLSFHDETHLSQRDSRKCKMKKNKAKKTGWCRGRISKRKEKEKRERERERERERRGGRGGGKKEENDIRKYSSSSVCLEQKMKPKKSEFAH